ncbi:MAG: PD40 domain-containing protein [Anaerolineae bacterium]|nr:PD40 domain-containing protein [Anaerolineae bacterium]
MKRLVTLSLALALGLVMSLFATAGQPAQAQEDLDTILARAAARSFLTILTRPELASALDFYTADTLRTDNVLAELGDVTSYQITSADWLKPNETYQVEATLQPGGRDIIVRTGKYNNRWQVDGLELPASGAVAQTAAGSAQAAGLQPVAGNGTGKLVFQTQSGGDIYVINADGTGLSRVTHGLDPQLSPDGSQIVFTRWDPQYELFTINVDGTNEQAWFSGKRQMKSPTWSADGTKLVFSFQDGGRLEGELKKYSLKGLARKDSPVRIPDNARGIEFDQDGLEFFIPPDAYWWLAQIDIQNEEYEDLATGSRYNYAPSWDPADPNRLFYRTDKGIGLYYADSHTSQPVSFDDRDRGGLAVSPDGTKVAFTYYQDGNWEIHTINLDGTDRQRLTETPLAVVASQNQAGNEVYINEEGFRTMSRAHGDSQPNNNWNNAAPAWSPDGSQIAFVTDRTGQWEIWIMNADGSNQHAMFPNGALDGIALNFAGVDERMLSWR